MSVDMYAYLVNRKQDEQAKLQKVLANEAKKSADLEKKISNAQASISRTKSNSIIRSKYQEIERCRTQLVTVEKKKADIAKKLAKVGKELSDARQNLQKEEAREAKKQLETTKRFQQQTLNTLSKHEQHQLQTERRVKKLENPPQKIKVLFIASSPIDQDELRLDEEIHNISEMIRKSEHRDSVELVSAWAVRPLDILQELNIHEPAIVHFSGHGSSNDELVLQDNNGKTKLISKEAIVQAMATTTSGIRLVFLNACYSYQTAQSICEHVEAAIGMNDSIGDEAARIFSAQFYSAIGFGKSVNNAFEQAKAALMLEGIQEENIPVLFLKDGIDGDQLIIVNPSNGNVSL